MRVPDAEVVAVLRSPEAEYPSPARYGPGRKVVLGGRLAVVVANDSAVLTVLWRSRTARHEAAASG
jgi:hypothetical protein